MLQVHASVHGLKLITFDADGTLYADGAHMDHDNEMINHILMLLHNKVSSPGMQKAPRESTFDSPIPPRNPLLILIV